MQSINYDSLNSEDRSKLNPPCCENNYLHNY